MSAICSTKLNISWTLVSSIREASSHIVVSYPKKAIMFDDGPKLGNSAWIPARNELEQALQG
jgi:hypothetical protein